VSPSLRLVVVSLSLLGPLLLGPSLVGSGGAALSAPKPVAIDYADSGYVRLDPMWASTRANDERLILAVFEGLTRIDAVTGKVAPAAAESWTSASDGRSWTFTLRAGAKWTDGTPVKAQDFVRAWKRILDVERDDPSPWRSHLRPIRGVGAMLDNDYGRRVLERLQKEIGELVKEHKEGVPGRALRDVVEASGLKAVVGVQDQPLLKKLTRWGDDRFPPKQAAEVLEVLKSERRARKTPTFEAYDAFGVSQGAIAKDDRTLVVETEGWVPALPELLARGVFSPLPEAMKEGREVGDRPDVFVGNGPFKLLARGAPPGGGTMPTPSVVHVVKCPSYNGPAPAQVDEIRCWTDEPGQEEIRRFQSKQLQWLASPHEELKKEIEALPGFRTRPTGGVVCLRLRADGEPFEKRAARRALALAIDRTRLLKTFWPAAEAAERLVPPMVKGLGAGVRAPAFDAAQALASLKEAGYGPEKEPAFDLRYAEEQAPLDGAAKSLAAGWSKHLKIGEVSWMIEVTAEVTRVLRAGTYTAFVTMVRGGYDDPLAFLEGFSASAPDGGLGWKDEAFEAFLAGAKDVDAAAAQPDLLLGKATRPTTKELLASVKASPSEANRSALRQALLLEAEQRLLDEAVVVPLAFLRTPEVLGGVTGLGSDAAWSNPAFVGSLRDAKRVP
jgi:ABC-type oligopeptide transport system substrate-binding subunit